MYLSSLCSDCKLCLFNGRPDTVRASGSASNPTGLLMTSSVIASLLLLTPALKNNIYPVCHHRTVGVCVCMCLPVFASDFNDGFHSPLLSQASYYGGNGQTVCVKQIFLRKSGSRELRVQNQKPPCLLIIIQLGAT